MKQKGGSRSEQGSRKKERL